MSLFKKFRLHPYSKVNDSGAKAISKQLQFKLERSDFDGAELFLLKSSDQSRAKIIYGFADEIDSIEVASRWIAARQHSSIAHTVLGASYIVTGWKIRGGSYADEVEKSSWEPFEKYLQNASDILRRAIHLDNKNSESHAWLLTAIMAGSEEREELHNIFLTATLQNPLHHQAHYSYFATLTKKWGGSHQEMFDFARSTTAKAPAGHMLHFLVANAFTELYLSIDTDNGTQQASQTLKQVVYAKEVAIAFYKWLDAKPSNLEMKLEQLSGSFALDALNQFAVALYATGARNETRAALRALNGEIQTLPWAWIGQGGKERMNAAFVYDRVCRELDVPHSN